MKICPRCGTEHDQPDGICPRCFYGRPRQKVKLPVWMPWAIVGFAAVLITAVVILFVSLQPKVQDDSWIDGDWEGKDIAILLDAEEHTFQLISKETVLYGTFAIDEETATLRLTDEEKHVYAYTYYLKDPNTMNVSFADGIYVVRETLERRKYEE